MFEPAFIIYFISIVVYFSIHSLLASLWFKQQVFYYWPNLQASYRLLFNFIAVISLIPIIMVISIYPGEQLWQWLGWQAVVANLLAIAALVGFYLSLSDYDLNEFFGVNIAGFCLYTKPIKEKFYLGIFHLYVRHPWYFFMLVIIWTRDMTTYQLFTAILISIYLYVGSYLEERKLQTYFGKVYETYQQKVPGLLPLPWKYLSRKEADELIVKSIS